MDNNTVQNNTPNMESSQPEQGSAPMQPQGSKSKSSWGPVIGLIIILVLIIAGAFYFFRTDQLSKTSNDPSAEDIENDLTELQAQSQSDEIGDIEADLEATNLDNLDAEVGAIEEEF